MQVNRSSIERAYEVLFIRMKSNKKTCGNLICDLWKNVDWKWMETNERFHQTLENMSDWQNIGKMAKKQSKIITNFQLTFFFVLVIILLRQWRLFFSRIADGVLQWFHLLFQFSVFFSNMHHLVLCCMDRWKASENFFYHRYDINI